MPVGLRLKGLNTTVKIIKEGASEINIKAIRDHEIEFVNEIITEGYLGQLTDDRDEIFTGIRGSMTIHLSSTDAFGLITDVKARASSEFPARTVKFHVEAQFRFPDNTIMTVRALDVFWSGFPISQSGRKEYVSMRVNYESSDAQISKG